MDPLPQVQLDGPAVVIADLHLDAFDEDPCAKFQGWVRGLEVGTLFVLGDLFDAWLGPAHEGSPGALLVMEAFREFAARGGQVHVLRGNRDFLLGASFEQRSASQVHPEGLTVRLSDGSTWLFLHGDELCTRDHAYQRLRRVTHSSIVQRWGPGVPLFLSRRIAARRRRYSTQAVAQKPSAEKEIQESAAQEHVQQAGCVGLLCGHVHRARDQELGADQRWLILDVFGDGERDALQIDAAGQVALVSSAGVSSGGTIQ